MVDNNTDIAQDKVLNPPRRPPPPLQEQVEHRRRLGAHQVASRAEEEDIKRVEFQAQQRMWALEQELVQAAQQSAMQDELSAKQAELELQQRRAFAQWGHEDDQRQVQQRVDTERREQKVAAAEQLAAQKAAQNVMINQARRHAPCCITLLFNSIS